MLYKNGSIIRRWTHSLWIHIYVMSYSLTRSNAPRIFINPLPNNKILDFTKLEELEDNKFKVAKMRISLYDRVENTVGKGENAGYQHFLLFPQCFPKSSSLKVGIVW